MYSQSQVPASSDQYLGRRGKIYFAYQNQGGLQRGRINARKFAPHIRPTDVVLDFGCGNGSLLWHWECKRRIGVDVINPAAREAAGKLEIEVYATWDTVSDNSVDVVISNHALEHVPCPLHALQGLRAKLKPRGQ